MSLDQLPSLETSQRQEGMKKKAAQSLCLSCKCTWLSLVGMNTVSSSSGLCSARRETRRVGCVGLRDRSVDLASNFSTVPACTPEAQLHTSRRLLLLRASTMRPLTEDESKLVFTKLANYIVRYLSFFHWHEPNWLDRLGQEPRPSHRQARRAILLSTTQRQSVLCIRINYETWHFCRSPQPS